MKIINFFKSMPTVTSKLAVTLLILAPLFWAGNFLVGKIANAIIPPFTFAFMRWLVVTLCLAPFAIPTVIEEWTLIRKHFRSLCILAFLSVFSYTAFVYWGLHYTTVVKASLLNATVPIIILLLSTVLLNEKLTIKKIVGVILSIVGAFLLIMRGNVHSIDLSFNQGDFLIIIAAISWAIFSVYYKKHRLRVSPLLFLFMTATIGTFMLLPAFLIERHLGYITTVNLTFLFSVGYAAIFSSILAFTFWNMGVMSKGPTQAGYFFNLLPVFSTLLAIIFLGEKLHTYEVIGFILILLGILLSGNFFTSFSHNIKGLVWKI